MAVGIASCRSTSTGSTLLASTSVLRLQFKLLSISWLRMIKRGCFSKNHSWGTGKMAHNAWKDATTWMRKQLWQRKLKSPEDVLAGCRERFGTIEGCKPCTKPPRCCIQTLGSYQSFKDVQQSMLCKSSGETSKGIIAKRLRLLDR